MAFLLRRTLTSGFLTSRTIFHITSPIARNFTSNPESKKSLANDLKLSDPCVQRLKEICADGSFLRVIVEGGGCSGFQYKFEIDTKVENDDLTFGPKDARVVVDNTSIGYIAGSTVDYHKELIKAGFRIIGNAQADHGCSCGASFSLKVD